MSSSSPPQGDNSPAEVTPPRPKRGNGYTTGDENNGKKTKYSLQNTFKVTKVTASNGNLTYPRTNFHVISVKGGLELIFCDKGKTEGYIRQLTSCLFPRDDEDQSPTDSDLAKATELQNKWKTFAIVGRRVSKEDHKYKTQPGRDKNGNEVEYRQQYLVRFTGTNQFDKEETKQVLKEMAEVSAIFSGIIGRTTS